MRDGKTGEIPHLYAEFKKDLKSRSESQNWIV